MDPAGRLDEIVYPNQVTKFDYYGETDDFRLKEIANLEPADYDHDNEFF